MFYYRPYQCTSLYDGDDGMGMNIESWWSYITRITEKYSEKYVPVSLDGMKIMLEMQMGWRRMKLAQNLFDHGAC